MILVFITTQPKHDNSHKKLDYSWYEKRGVTTFLIDLSPCIYEKKSLDKIYKQNKVVVSNYIKINEISKFDDVIKKFSGDSLFFLVAKTITNKIALQDQILSTLNKTGCNYVISEH